jgi:hypothetical protein
MKLLRRRVIDYEEPESVITLKMKNEKEKEYLQRTIIMMELKQLAESISMITHQGKLKMDIQAYTFKNRPLLWEERIKRKYEQSQIK